MCVCVCVYRMMDWRPAQGVFPAFTLCALAMGFSIRYRVGVIMDGFNGIDQIKMCLYLEGERFYDDNRGDVYTAYTCLFSIIYLRLHT